MFIYLLLFIFTCFFIPAPQKQHNQRQQQEQKQHVNVTDNKVNAALFDPLNSKSEADSTTSNDPFDAIGMSNIT